jgi:Transaldolase/Fructose-6-phosphate aldolase
VEVPPGLAYDAEHSVQVARRLHHQADRPSLLVKIRGIPPGLTAMAQLITEGSGSTPAPLHGKLGLAITQKGYASYRSLLQDQRWASSTPASSTAKSCPARTCR